MTENAKRQMKLRKTTLTLALTAVLAALSLALSLLEGMFTPFLPPGVKPGFSNIAVMVAALLCGAPSALFLALFKSLFALATRGTVAFLMSFAGGITSVVLMLILFRKATRVGLAGISILGALTHNASQIAVACLLLGRAVLSYAPVSLLFSLPCGLVTGAVLSATLGPVGRALSSVTRADTGKNNTGKGNQPE